MELRGGGGRKGRTDGGDVEGRKPREADNGQENRREGGNVGWRDEGNK